MGGSLTNGDLRAVHLYMEEYYDIRSQKLIDEALFLVADENQYHLIRDYLKSRDIRVGYVMGGSKLLGDALVQEVFDTFLEVKVYGQ